MSLNYDKWDDICDSDDEENPEDPQKMKEVCSSRCCPHFAGSL